MDLAPLASLLTILAVTLSITLTAALLPAPLRRPVMWTAGLATVAVALTALATFGFIAAVSLWRDDPAEAGLVSVVLGGFVVAVAVHVILGGPHARLKRNDDGNADSDNGDGGQRRPPTPPAPSSPGDPILPPSPDWETFDDLRREWDRVPVGR